MSVKNLFMMIFMVIVFPIMIIFCNIDAFFLIMSIVLVLLSIGSLHSLITSSEVENDEEDWETEEVEESFSEVGEVLGVNARKMN